MFSDSTIRELTVDDEAAYVSALVGKLVDLDRNRIHSTDALVLRKAVFGLLEVVAELERRLIALEGPGARAEWGARLASEVHAPTPDQVLLGE